MDRWWCRQVSKRRGLHTAQMHVQARLRQGQGQQGLRNPVETTKRNEDFTPCLTLASLGLHLERKLNRVWFLSPQPRPNLAPTQPNPKCWAEAGPGCSIGEASSHGVQLVSLSSPHCLMGLLKQSHSDSSHLAATFPTRREHFECRKIYFLLCVR